MSQFASKFDLVTEESFAAPGAAALTLETPATGVNSQGTPVPGTITAGSIVKIGTNGKAETASSADLAANAAPVMPLVVIDGNDTFSGSFVNKVTCLAGGFQMKTDQFAAGSYTPGAPVSFNAGKVCVWQTGKQVLGFVGKDGLNLSTQVLHVVVAPKF